MLHNNPGVLALQERIKILRDSQDQLIERKNIVISRSDREKQKVRELEIKLKKAQLECNDLQDELNELNQEKAKKEQEYQDKLSQKKTTQQQLSQKEDKLSTIKSEVNAKKQERQRVKKRLEELNEMVKHPVVPIRVYNHDLCCTADQYHYCSAHYNDPSYIEDAADCQTYQSALKERSSLIQVQNKLSAEHAELESKSYRAESEVEDEREKLQRHESALNSCQETISKVEKKIQTAQQKLESKSDELRSLETDVADVKSLLEESLAEKGSIESEINIKQNALDHLKLELKRLEAEINKKFSQEQGEEARKQLIEERARQALIEETARNQLIEEQARQELQNEGFALNDIVTTLTDVWPNAVSGLLTNSIFNGPQMQKLEKELGGNPKEHTGNLLLDSVKNK